MKILHGYHRAQIVSCVKYWWHVVRRIVNVAFSATSFDAPKFAVRVFAADGKSAINKSQAFYLFWRLMLF